jgi:hypothetical protein
MRKCSFFAHYIAVFKIGSIDFLLLVLEEQLLCNEDLVTRIGNN